MGSRKNQENLLSMEDTQEQFSDSEGQADVDGRSKESPQTPDGSSPDKYGGSHKKTRGRVKIDIELIRHKQKRSATFHKRKGGLMKKGFELSVLTGSEVLVLAASRDSVFSFATKKLQSIFKSSVGQQLIQSCLQTSAVPDDDLTRSEISHTSSMAPRPAAPRGRDGNAGVQHGAPGSCSSGSEYCSVPDGYSETEYLCDGRRRETFIRYPGGSRTDRLASPGRTTSPKSPLPTRACSAARPVPISVGAGPMAIRATTPVATACTAMQYSTHTLPVLPASTHIAPAPYPGGSHVDHLIPSRTTASPRSSLSAYPCSAAPPVPMSVGAGPMPIRATTPVATACTAMQYSTHTLPVLPASTHIAPAPQHAQLVGSCTPLLPMAHLPAVPIEQQGRISSSSSLSPATGLMSGQSTMPSDLNGFMRHCGISPLPQPSSTAVSTIDDRTMASSVGDGLLEATSCSSSAFASRQPCTGVLHNGINPTLTTIGNSSGSSVGSIDNDSGIICRSPASCDLSSVDQFKSLHGQVACSSPPDATPARIRQGLKRTHSTSSIGSSTGSSSSSSIGYASQGSGNASSHFVFAASEGSPSSLEDGSSHALAKRISPFQNPSPSSLGDTGFHQSPSCEAASAFARTENAPQHFDQSLSSERVTGADLELSASFHIGNLNDVSHHHTSTLGKNSGSGSSSHLTQSPPVSPVHSCSDQPIQGRVQPDSEEEGDDDQEEDEEEEGKEEVDEDEEEHSDSSGEDESSVFFRVAPSVLLAPSIAPVYPPSSVFSQQLHQLQPNPLCSREQAHDSQLHDDLQDEIQPPQLLQDDSFHSFSSQLHRQQQLQQLRRQLVRGGCMFSTSAAKRMSSSFNPGIYSSSSSSSSVGGGGGGISSSSSTASICGAIGQSALSFYCGSNQHLGHVVHGLPLPAAATQHVSPNTYLPPAAAAAASQCTTAAAAGVVMQHGTSSSLMFPAQHTQNHHRVPAAVQTAPGTAAASAAIGYYPQLFLPANVGNNAGLPASMATTTTAAAASSQTHCQADAGAGSFQADLLASQAGAITNSSSVLPPLGTAALAMQSSHASNVISPTNSGIWYKPQISRASSMTGMATYR